MSKFNKKIFFLLLLFGLMLPKLGVEANLAENQKGKILLQVEENGEAWYVNPKNLKRYYLGRPEDAFNVMRGLGVGITNNDLNKIEIGNKKEQASVPALLIDKNFSLKQKGKILLQVEENGEAWYVNPKDLKRYYLGRPEDAFNVMRELGVGITNKNLNQITAHLSSEFEKKIFQSINKERANFNLSELRWNDEVANVAREHSQNLADENLFFTGKNKACDFPTIHHEGINFGLYHSDRLKERKFFSQSKSAENIALVPNIKTTIRYNVNNKALIKELAECNDKRKALDSEFNKKLSSADNEAEKIKIIKEEIANRFNLFEGKRVVNVAETINLSDSQILESMVDGWMNSPGHRQNILTSDFDETGIGIAEVNGYIIATQIFIKRVDCGYQTGKCCTKENYYPTCFIPLKCENMVCVE